MNIESLQDYFAENRARLLPLLLFLMIMGCMAYLLATKVYPAWQSYQLVSSQVREKRDELTARDAAASEDNRMFLETQVESQTTALLTSGEAFLTQTQSEGMLERLYRYAEANAIQILSVQVQNPIDNVPIAEDDTSGYVLRSFHLELSGETEDLMAFVGHLNEASLPVVTINNLTLSVSPEIALLSLDLNLYSSDYANGSSLDSVLSPLSAEVIPDSSEDATLSSLATPTAVPIASVESEIDDPMLLLASVRLDLERLAVTQYGENRPAGWSGEQQITNPQFAIYVRLDIEILAGNRLGETVRPIGWIGAVPGAMLTLAQDSRHDLELLADALLQGRRPEAWLGAHPLLRCSRATISLVQFLASTSDFRFDGDSLDSDFCVLVEESATNYVYSHSIDTNFLESESTGDAPLAYYINSEFAVAFNSRFAELRLGLIPEGVSFVPLGRSYVQFSNMMLIRGENFEVFIDYHFTSMSEIEFLALPDINEIPSLIGCHAYWCTG